MKAVQARTASLPWRGSAGRAADRQGDPHPLPAGQGYPTNALAEKLSVSDSTVRTRLRNINGKLGAQNRKQAAEVARRLGIIRWLGPGL